MNWKDNLAVEYYDTIHIVYVIEKEIYGTVDTLGAFASAVKYTIDGIEYEDLLENEEFMIMDEITFLHVEEEN